MSVVVGKLEELGDRMPLQRQQVGPRTATMEARYCLP